MSQAVDKTFIWNISCWKGQEDQVGDLLLLLVIQEQCGLSKNMIIHTFSNNTRLQLSLFRL